MNNSEIKMLQHLCFEIFDVKTSVSINSDQCNAIAEIVNTCIERVEESTRIEMKELKLKAQVASWKEYPDRMGGMG